MNAAEATQVDGAGKVGRGTLESRPSSRKQGRGSMQTRKREGRSVTRIRTLLRGQERYRADPKEGVPYVTAGAATTPDAAEVQLS